MRVKIVSDGTRQGTLITDADTGEPIDGVVALKWEVGDPNGQPYCLLKCRSVAVDVVAEAERTEAEE